jgi:hypothetical protein
MNLNLFDNHIARSQVSIPSASKSQTGMAPYPLCFPLELFNLSCKDHIYKVEQNDSDV